MKCCHLSVADFKIPLKSKYVPNVLDLCIDHNNLFSSSSIIDSAISKVIQSILKLPFFATNSLNLCLNNKVYKITESKKVRTELFKSNLNVDLLFIENHTARCIY